MNNIDDYLNSNILGPNFKPKFHNELFQIDSIEDPKPKQRYTLRDLWNYFGFYARKPTIEEVAALSTLVYLSYSVEVALFTIDAYIENLSTKSELSLEFDPPRIEYAACWINKGLDKYTRLSKMNEW